MNTSLLQKQRHSLISLLMDLLLIHVNCYKSLKATESLWDLKIFPAVKSSHDNQSELSAKHLL